MAQGTAQPRIRDRVVARTLPLVPRRLVRRLSRPYIAGSTIAEAVASVQELHANGMSTTVDVLGESVRREHETECTTREYVKLLEALGQLGDRDLVNVSVKLTGLGLAFDRDLAYRQVHRIASKARELNGFLRIDMEDSPYTDATLDIHEELVGEGLDNVGVVLQAYLKRSAADAERLGASQTPVRLVKGIYIEPQRIAWRDMSRINQSFVELADTLFASGSRVALATHDRALVEPLVELLESRGVQRDQYEFQMLLGVTEQLRGELLDAGHPMRVYVPFGQQWFEYSIRRLRENPRIAGYVAADVLRGMVPGRNRHQMTATDVADPDVATTAPAGEPTGPRQLVDTSRA